MSPYISSEKVVGIRVYSAVYCRAVLDVVGLTSGGEVIRLIEVDDFIENLWRVHTSVKKEGYVQSLSLGLFRSDYMLHAPPNEEVPSLRQVEFNTISSSFGGLSALVTSMHTHLLTFPDPAVHLAYPDHELFEAKEHGVRTGEEPSLWLSNPDRVNNLPPDNNAVQVLQGGLSAAHNAYGPSKSQPQLPLCVLFIVQDQEHNIFDQLALSTNAKFPIFRLSTKEILSHTSINSENALRPLVYTPPSSPTTHFEVTTIYLRALYAPSEYATVDSWRSRLHLERSAAIKCPTVLTQLAGCKKVQQILTSTSPTISAASSPPPSTAPYHPFAQPSLHNTTSVPTQKA